ncbi:unnamed protein product [Effrenium voratum]|nr:unnamed protein product [Effrenium voratum]
MRLLDIKLGTETSVAGWKGKSRLHAWKNACVDQRTNSAVEGFRLEGIEMPPRSLEERILAVVNAKSTSATAKYISPKVIRRFTLQRLRAAEFLESWLDVSHFGPGSEVHAQKALLESFRQVQGLVQAVVALEVPQQWIGSSVALALEVGTMARLSVVVKVFDWGRAELTTAEEFAALKVEAQESRGHYWRQYLRALGRLFWELGRLAVHRCCCPAWQVLILELRSLSPAVFRAAVLGAGESFGTVPVTCGMGFFQMAPEGGAGEVSVPLLGSSPDEPVVGSVRVHVTAPEGGVGLTAVRVLEAELLVQELDLATVRVLAFERLGDAKMHLEAFQRGERSAPARGHVCCQSTGPGRCGGDGRPGRLVWEDRLEFSAGPLAREAVSLLEALPSPESWTEMLPPSTASCEEVEEKAKVFLKQLIPWLDAPFPTKLHSDPSCAE